MQASVSCAAIDIQELIQASNTRSAALPTIIYCTDDKESAVYITSRRETKDATADNPKSLNALP
jgi:hypothetical protein